MNTTSDLIPCTEPGVWLELANATVHLTRWPRTDRSALSYCPVCLGFGTTRVDKRTEPFWVKADVSDVKVGDYVMASVTYKGSNKDVTNEYVGTVRALNQIAGMRSVETPGWYCTDSPNVRWFIWR